MAITFNVTTFRAQFPAFFNVATCYVSDADYGRLTGDCRLYALTAMTAHLAAISDLAAAGNTPAFVTSSTIGSVSVSVQPPPNTDQWEWWMNLTPYGQQLLALLTQAGVGGFLVGGSPERSPFRQVGGGFL